MIQGMFTFSVKKRFIAAFVRLAGGYGGRGIRSRGMVPEGYSPWGMVPGGHGPEGCGLRGVQS